MLGIYCRVSTEAQDDNYSIKEQKVRGVKFSESLQIEYQIYEDIKSGSTLERPFLTKLLTDIENKIISKVWIIEFTRLSRNVTDSLHLKNLFIENKIELYINNELQKLDTLDNFLTFGINSLISDYERQRISERMQRGVLNKKRNGGQWFRYIYGYKRVVDPETGNKVVVINEEQAEIIRQVFHDFADDEKSYKSIATDLNKRQIPSLTTNVWDTSKIMRMVNHEIYTGYYHFEGKRTKSISYDAIITDDLFQKALERKKKISQGYNRSHRYTNHKCSSLTHCYYCNVNLIHHSKKQQNKTGLSVYNLYKILHKNDCTRVVKKNQISKSKLDILFDNLIIRCFADRIGMEKLYKKSEAENIEKKKEIKYELERFNSILNTEQKKKAKLMDLLLDEDFSDDEDMKGKLKEITKIIKQTKINIQEVYNKQILTNSQLADVAMKLGTDYIYKYLNATDFNKREIIMEFIKESYIKDWILNITFITGKKYIIELDKIPEWFQKPIFESTNNPNGYIWLYHDEDFYDYYYSEDDGILYKIDSGLTPEDSDYFESVYDPSHSFEKALKKINAQQLHE